MENAGLLHNTSCATFIVSEHSNIKPDTRPKYKPIPAFSERQLAKFWAKVDRRGPTECWPWKGAVTVGRYGAKYGKWNRFRPHRITYTLLVGPIPDGMTLDHLKESGVCSTSLCCNPAHTEPVTAVVNTERYYESIGHPRGGTVLCKHGHLRTVGKPCKGCGILNARLHRERARRREVAA